MATKKLNIAPPPGADNPNKALYGNVQPGLDTSKITQEMVRPTGTAFNPNQDLMRAQMAYDAQQKPVQQPQAPQQPQPQIQNNYGGLSQDFIKSNPNQAVSDLVSKGYSSSQAQQLVNKARGIKSSLTLNSSDYTSAPVISQPNIPSLADTLTQVKGMFTPLDQAKKDEIAKQVASEFVPKIAEQNRINAIRQTQYKASEAQRGGAGFGRSDLGYQGENNTAQYGADMLSRLNDLQAQETQARISAAESANTKQQQDYLDLATKLRNQQLQEFQQTFQNNMALENQKRADSQATYQRAQSQLNLITDLSPEQIAQLGDLSGLEAGLGLPPGYMSALQATKQGAATAKSAEDFSKFFNDATKLSLSTPAGQEFTLRDPIEGNEYTFQGTQNDVQIVSSNGGIWAVDKNKQSVTQLKAPKASGGGGGGGKAENFQTWLANQPNFVKSLWSNGGEGTKNDIKKQYQSYKSDYTGELPPKITANDVWKELSKPENAGLPDDEKARWIMSEGLNPTTFGLDVPTE